jgi:tetratricopeptide (TPR) repeat protein
MTHKQTCLFLTIAVVFSAALVFAGCASTVKIEFEGNESVGDRWSCRISPEGVVRLVSDKFNIYLPFPGMGGKFVFKFEAIAEGEAEILLTHYFRGTPRGVIIYKTVVDKGKKLILNEDVYDVTMLSVEAVASRLGIEPFDLKNYEEAVTWLTETIRQNPNHADAYYTRGLAYFTAGEYNSARADFEAALRIYPEHVKAEFYLDIVTRFYGSE